MKKKLVLTFILVVSSLMFGQDILDIPPLDGDGKPALVDAIVGDTTATGERVSANRVYRLEREGIYIFSSTLRVDFPIHFIANDGDGRPPMLVRGKSEAGANIRPLMRFTSDTETHSFKNVFIQGVDLERKYFTEWFSGLEFQGDSTSVSFSGVVFNAFTAGAAVFTGKDNSAYFNDCVWRNGVWPNHPFVGQQHNFGEGGLDTLIVTNSTYFNNNSYWLFTPAVADYVVIEHNTIFTSIVDAIHLKTIVHGNIRSNLFYGYAAYGDTEYARQENWYESDASPLSITSFDELPVSSNFTEADRVINVTHNAYFTPQAIADYHAAYDTVTGAIWMNDRTQNMFNDNTTWPGLTEGDNVELDPKFEDAVMDAWVVDEVAKFCTENRETASGGWGTASGYRNYDEHLGNDMLSEVQWPLPENMKITDATLLTAGHDGLPVGDLNWDPTLRAQYVLDPITDIKNDNTNLAPTDYSLSQNYPNPFNPTTVINFSVPEQGITTLKVFNILGQEVVTLLNKDLATGSYNFEFDGHSLTTGIYFYQLKTNNYSEMKKMMLIK